MFICISKVIHKMGRKKNVIIWRHFNKKNNGATCSFCKIHYKVANVNKMEKHLLSCFHCPDYVKRSLKPSNGKTMTTTALNQDEQMELSNHSVATSSTDSTSNISNETVASQPALSTPSSSTLSSSTPSSSKTFNPKKVSSFFDRISDEENVSVLVGFDLLLTFELKKLCLFYFIFRIG